MRYFLTTNASRPYVTDGFTFTFEPVQNRGGSWLGVLAVEEDSTASTLASAALVGVDEITLERFDMLKKKVSTTPIGTSASPRPPRVALPASVGGVRLVEPSARTPGVGNPLIPRPAKVAVVEADVALQSTMAQPPAEPLLDSPSLKANRRFSAKMRAA